MIRSNYFLERKKYKIDVYAYKKNIIREFRKKWKKILSLILSDKPKDWSDAVKRADNLLSEILKMSGYSGISIEQILSTIDDSKIKGIDDFKKIRSEFFIKIDKNNYNLKDAKKALRSYRSILNKLGIL